MLVFWKMFLLNYLFNCELDSKSRMNQTIVISYMHFVYHYDHCSVMDWWVVIDFKMSAYCYSVYSTKQQSLQIAFDVYQPGLNFKKSDPGTPDFCVSVCR